MGQIIKSVVVYLCVYVCVYVWTRGRIFQPIYTKFGRNLWGQKLRKGRID